MTSPTSYEQLLPAGARPLAFGLLRLCTEERPSAEQAIAVIHAALDGGVRIVDTADSYCLTDKESHYGETLVARALASFAGPRDEVRVVTKVGLTRPKGRWAPDGSAAHLRKAVEGSLRALGVERIGWLLLHAIDPRVPFDESLATLAALRAEGKIEHVGLSNVELAHLVQAERAFPVAAIENELSVIDRSTATEGVVALAKAWGVPLLAHRPLGGHAKADALAKNRVLKALSTRHGWTPAAAALAIVADLGKPVIPLFGARTVAHVQESIAASQLRLDDEDRKAIAAKVSFAPTERARALAAWPPPAAPPREGEVVLVMGIQGAGKSTTVERFVDQGFTRLNRDELGGGLDDLLEPLEAALAKPTPRVVLDNTYPTRASRFAVIRAAAAAGVAVRAVWLDTPFDEAMWNVAARVVGRHGALIGPDEHKALSKTDPNLPPAAALGRFAASFEAPTIDEGFASVEVVSYVRRPRPAATKKALLLDVDGTLRTTKSGEPYPRSVDDVALLPGRTERLARAIAEGYRLFFVSNQSGVASGKVDRATVDAAFAKTIELLGVPVDEVAYCPHPAFPVGCFCRKPLPGLAVWLAERHQLDRDAMVMVGDLGSDEAFAKAIGATFVESARFFGDATTA
jgi:HAD superfamily hydrolase (TIGR01662 family)